MRILAMLYGTQYDEITKAGKDGNKGRFNGNIFLTVFLMLLFFTLYFGLQYLSPDFERMSSRWVRHTFGANMGRGMAKILALAIMGIIYLIVSNTVGTVPNFNKYKDQFLALPEEVKAKANRVLLTRFFVLLGLFIVLVALVA